MKYLSLENMREGKFNSILKKEKSYLYEFEFVAGKHISSHPIGELRYTLPEVDEWLKNSIKGNYKIIIEMGVVWGVSFQKRQDALLFKMVWS